MSMTGRGNYATGDTHQSILESEGLKFLLAGNGTVWKEVPLTVLEGKTICLFFSANWCRPCRTFTPLLIQLYNSLKDDNKLEIIFVSLDREESSYLEHLKHIPWLAAPFDTATTKRLCDRYNINRIPSLIPLASDGVSVEEDAVQLVEDYRMDAFPFGAKRRKELKAMDEKKRNGGNLEQLLGSKYVISRDGNQIPIVNLVGKMIGLYFGAHWCPPCRSFTTTLVEAYNELNGNNNNSSIGGFQIIFISTDRDEEDFKSSLRKMPWLAVPYRERSTRHELSRIFNVKCIPTLVILGPDGKIFNADGRAMISSYGAKAFPFTESRAAEMEMALMREGEGLPRQVRDLRHEHVLKLDMAKAYVCDHCGHQGRYWVFSCDLCNFDLHPACVEELKQ